MLDQSYYAKTDEIIEHYGPKPASLIPIMQDIQAEYRYLPGELLTYVASKIGVTEAKAYSVATFYDMLFTVETVSCLGACGLAPTLTVNDEVHPKMTPEKAIDLLNELRGETV